MINHWHLRWAGRAALANYFPSIKLCDDDYELSLMIFETYHMISNMNEWNNKFYFGKDDAEITIPKDSYEVRNKRIFETCDFTDTSAPRRTWNRWRNNNNT